MKGIVFAAMASLMATAAYGEYTLKTNNGKYPEGVKIENLNGNLPEETWYKRGWTEDGWSIGDYGTLNCVALSPSHVAEGDCENALTLPSITIEEGEWLSWEACEVYPLFKDTYTVEFQPEGNEKWTTLGEFTVEESTWATHMIDLAPYAGKRGMIRFVCRSSEGYMLALNNVAINRPTDYSFTSSNHTPKFFAAGDLVADKAAAEITIMNTGAPIPNAVIELTIDGTPASTLQEDAFWPTGETRNYQLPLPLTRNVRADYKLTIETPDGEKHPIGESFAYCTSFRRNLFVDKGTGMWCTSCPNGTLLIEELEATYGDALIVAETHNKDLLANDAYFSWLKFYSIPHVMLNRIQSTKGETALKFEDQICIPTEMEINITDLSTKSDGTLTASASVSTSEAFAATDRSYRIGYVLTRNVSGEENVMYYQKNICTLGKQKQFCYLPSRMIFSMCSFPNVTIPSQLATTSDDPAFTGIAGSLPESLAPGATYEYEWDIPLPEGFDNFDGMRLVAYILDAGNRNIINSTAKNIADYAGVEEILGNPMQSRADRIFTIDGRQVRGDKSTLLPGIYIINGEKTLIK